jgi:hypothetical protein
MCLFVAKTKRPPRIEEAAELCQTVTVFLVFIVAEQSALLQILAANAVSRPRHCIEAFLRQCFTAVNTLTVTGCFDSLERFIDQVQ